MSEKLKTKIEKLEGKHRLIADLDLLQSPFYLRVQINPFVIELLQLPETLGHLGAETDGITNLIVILVRILFGCYSESMGNQILHQPVDNSAVGRAEQLLTVGRDLVPADQFQFYGILDIAADVTDGV